MHRLYSLLARLQTPRVRDEGIEGKRLKMGSFPKVLVADAGNTLETAKNSGFPALGHAGNGENHIVSAGINIVSAGINIVSDAGNMDRRGNNVVSGMGNMDRRETSMVGGAGSIAPDGNKTDPGWNNVAPNANNIGCA